MNHKQCIQKAIEMLKTSDTKKLDAELLMMHLLNADKIKLITNVYELTEEQEQLYFSFVNERNNNKPLAYILNEKEFMGLNFYVDENVLIPRPDTEILVEKAIEIIKENSLKSFLEIGAGSGCISISLSHFTKIKGEAVDIFNENLNICKKNAKSNDVNNIDFYISDIFSNVNNTYDLIISNPPYIDENVFDTLGKNVVDFEPHKALFADNKGLYFYEEITKNAYKYLNKNGFLAFEIGYDQKEKVIDLMKNNNYTNIISLKDYGNLDRVVIGQLNF